ncbi:MAG: (d)CMP kinase [Alphaproteobacteria bacterium TMED89]|nr:cytidylate kinase [Rhodospirillaceae bacterium]RPH12654.1 MAG: (d)CMP kinase [Alphaproteobacteria bacterium TMED89]
MIIAIDGPAAAGKGTLARRLAAHFDFAYLDSGALYRAVGAKALDQGVDLGDVEGLVTLASGLIGEDMAHPHLRTPAVSEAASRVAALTPVRVALKDFQRNFADSPPGNKAGAVLDGRDIGTVICPYATCKLFITANRNVRAERRWLELREKDPSVIYDRVFNDLVVRDERDETREDSPLKPADDASLIDTSTLTTDEVFEQALLIIASSNPR